MDVRTWRDVAAQGSRTSVRVDGGIVGTAASKKPYYGFCGIIVAELVTTQYPFNLLFMSEYHVILSPKVRGVSKTTIANLSIANERELIRRPLLSKTAWFEEWRTATRPDASWTLSLFHDAMNAYGAQRIREMKEMWA